MKVVPTIQEASLTKGETTDLVKTQFPVKVWHQLVAQSHIHDRRGVKVCDLDGSHELTPILVLSYWCRSYHTGQSNQCWISSGKYSLEV